MKNSKKDKTLILVPKLSVLGGVSLHYSGLKNYWSKDIKYFETFRFGCNIIHSLILFISNYISYIYSLITYKPNKLVINVSLKRGFFSKNLYLRLALLFNIKIIAYIHGWENNYEWMLKHPKGKFLLENSDAIIVLSKQFRDKLKNNGYENKKIHITTTKVDDMLLSGFDINKRNGTINKFLYLSRVEKGKGIELSLDIFKLINENFPQTTYTIAGDGKYVDEVKGYIKEKNIKNVTLVGKVTGTEISKLYSESDFFFLLSESEGMPAALLEAIAFGLPAATTPVGGIPEIFENKKMGILSNEIDPIYYYNRIEALMLNKDITKAISIYNYNFAKQKLYASVVAKELEDIFESI